MPFQTLNWQELIDPEMVETGKPETFDWIFEFTVWFNCFKICNSGKLQKLVVK